jgi:hypothetical protein
VAGTRADFKIYNEYIHTGMVETLTQVSDAFNAASRGTILLTTVNRKGDFVYESFFASTANLISRRDTLSTADAQALKLTQSDMVSVKVNRKIGPVENTLDSFKKVQQGQFNQNALDFAIGQQSAKGMQIEMLNTGLIAARAAIAGQAGSLVDKTAVTTGIATVDLVDALASFGDAAANISLWVMHSAQYYKLVKEQILGGIDGVSSFNVASATPITLNRPVLVSDSPSLISTFDDGGTPTTAYNCLGLTAGAVVLEDSEESTVFSEYVTGKENLIVRIQGEYAYNIGVKGFTWDVANGGANPDAAAMASGANWDPSMGDLKNRAGVVLRTR